jgi:uncharacterized protein (DUF58 family)
MPSDPTTLAQHSRLALRAREVVEGLLGGGHKSPFKGISVEFAEHRQYYPGDEIRHLDWRVLGKTDRLFIKEFEEETNLQAYFAVDASGSMAYAGSGPTKYDYASEVAVALAYLLLQQRDAVGLFLHDHDVRTALPPSTQTGQWLRLAKSLEDHRPATWGGHSCLPNETVSDSAGRNACPTGPLWQRLAERIPRRSMVILVSDAFAPLPELLLGLRRFRHARHEVLLLQVVAPEEADFPFRHGTRFRSLEDGRQITIDPQRFRADYRRAFDEFIEKLRHESGRMGVDHYLLRTDRPVAEALGEFLMRRASRTR